MRGVMLWGVVALAGGGCATARHVQQDRDGGVIAMSSNSGGSREKAMKLIADHVGPDYQIVDEREVVTGQSTRNHADTQQELTAHSEIPFLPAQRQTTVTTTTTSDVTEWHITYRRGAPMPVVVPTGAQVPTALEGSPAPPAPNLPK